MPEEEVVIATIPEAAQITKTTRKGLRAAERAGLLKVRYGAGRRLILLNELTAEAIAFARAHT